MSPEERDQSYLIDMLQYSKEVVDIIGNETLECFRQNRVKRLAIERLIEIIGEAANHVSIGKQQFMEKIEWSKVIGMRNKLAHDYGEILAERIWLISNTSVKQLIKVLEEYNVKI